MYKLNGLDCGGWQVKGADAVEFSMACAYAEVSGLKGAESLKVTDGDGTELADFSGYELVSQWEVDGAVRARFLRKLEANTEAAIRSLEENVRIVRETATATQAVANEAREVAQTGTPAMRQAMQLVISSSGLAPEDYAGFADLYDAFDPEVKYKKGRMVTYGGGVYRCIKNNASTVGTAPDADPDHWERVDVAAGGVEVWDPEKTYHKGDTCVYGGVTYVCQKNNVVGVTPGTNDKYWIVE